ncbi:hercules receptor kinase 2 [Actinidia rufa]|uniref:Hercules receptor kinase 2 n=1 Tax=Actinidia rufa TaxID=165716 RepID=A0A7J0H7X9_9ERIC|nr:hercules receptor kinase 2 [Actinidia rufa]
MYLFSFVFLCISISCNAESRYNPPDNIAVDCGSSGPSLAQDGRSWEGDKNSSKSFLEIVHSNSSIKSQAQTQPSDIHPYFTARISRSEFTYVIPVNSTGPKFIRLHFFPSSYQGFDPSTAFFTVKANQFTLLSNFSASLTAASLGQQTIAKEFCMNVEGDRRVKITFTPSETPPNAYAFINGIEIVSIPTNLYYGSGEPNGFKLIGYEANPYRLGNDKALEMTARSMGNDATTNNQYNLTWGLAVDSGFTYMVRLHFCEIEGAITKGGDREFLIYITNQIAETQADVIVWSGGNGVPVYKDYAVIVPQGTEKKQNLSVALHPASKTRTLYSDAILNGIEVFKLSDHYGNLARPNPDQPPPQMPSPIPRKLKNKHMLIAAIIGGTGTSSLPSDVCLYFSLPEIRAATNNFNSAFIIGRGGFGNVYKGYINGGSTQVAIKRLTPGSNQGVHEFMTEIAILSDLRHSHLVSLIGYCNEDHEMILVYEYMSRGTLRDHLYDSDNPPLSWKKRLQICIGAAKGLHYLHAGTKCMIIHQRCQDNQHTVLCARRPLDNTLEKDQVNLANWARSCYENKTLDQIVDGNLEGEIAPECLKKFGEIAVSCLNDDGIKRPLMNEVVCNLEFVLQLQEIADDGTKSGQGHNEFKDHDALLFNSEDNEIVASVEHMSTNGMTMASNIGTSFISLRDLLPALPHSCSSMQL